jgi:hypothetical protein
MSSASFTLNQGITVSPFQSIPLSGEKGIPLSRCKLVIIVCGLVTGTTTGTAAAPPPGAQIKSRSQKVSHKIKLHQRPVRRHFTPLLGHFGTPKPEKIVSKIPTKISQKLVSQSVPTPTKNTVNPPMKPKERTGHFIQNIPSRKALAAILS